MDQFRGDGLIISTPTGLHWGYSDAAVDRSCPCNHAIVVNRSVD